MNTHTCLTCDNQTNGGDQCIVCNPEGYVVDETTFSSDFIKDFGSVTLGNFKVRYELLNAMSNSATDYGKSKIARFVIWLQEREAN
tara:strand:- start:15717 stop:15974 length:258 start_codon:yes stop_codon:yes gene_type:complete